jgi:hypothetical protein
MWIDLRCACGASYRLPARHTGRHGRCVRCRARLSVPARREIDSGLRRPEPGAIPSTWVLPAAPAPAELSCAGGARGWDLARFPAATI